MNNLTIGKSPAVRTTRIQCSSTPGKTTVIHNYVQYGRQTGKTRIRTDFMTQYHKCATEQERMKAALNAAKEILWEQNM